MVIGRLKADLSIWNVTCKLLALFKIWLYYYNVILHRRNIYEFHIKHYKSLHIFLYLTNNWLVFTVFPKKVEKRRSPFSFFPMPTDHKTDFVFFWDHPKWNIFVAEKKLNTLGIVGPIRIRKCAAHFDINKKWLFWDTVLLFLSQSRKKEDKLTNFYSEIYISGLPHFLTKKERILNICSSTNLGHKKNSFLSYYSNTFLLLSVINARNFKLNM